jgi:hypothetical protein
MEGHDNRGDSEVLEEEFDPDYTPTEEELTHYAQFLDMDLPRDEVENPSSSVMASALIF